MEKKNSSNKWRYAWTWYYYVQETLPKYTGTERSFFVFVFSPLKSFFVQLINGFTYSLCEVNIF